MTLKKGALSLLVIVALFGVFIGGLMTWHHEMQLYGSGTGELIGCEANAEVNCDVVNTSEFSEILGVPIAAMAIPTYLLTAILGVLALRGRQDLTKLLLLIGLGVSAYAVFLYWVSVSRIHYVCAWCLRSYAVNAAILILALLGGGWKAPWPDRRALTRLGGVAALLFVVTLVGQKIYRSSLLGDSAQILESAQAVSSVPVKEKSGDPEGPAPVVEIEVQTEDKNTATLATLATDAWKGKADAKVVVVEFADFQCGYCKRASAQLKKLYQAYGDRVAFVFKHFPMSPSCNPGVKNNKHRYACRAAAASVCAQDQGHFWDFHDLAFKNQHQLKDEHLATYAETIGLDMDGYSRCMKDRTKLARVRADAEMGKSLDIHGTPRIFINGKLYRSGTSAEQMARAIELALGTPGAEATKAAKGLALERVAVRPIPADVASSQALAIGDDSFEIDTFEAGLDKGAATSGKHIIPATSMSWFAARDACEKAGKRLCSEKEWVAACQSSDPIDDDGDGQYADDLIEGNAYPYGDYHERNRCWDGKSGDGFRPVYTGEMPGCVTADGVYDLTGNVEEWVGLTEQTAVLLGGAFDTSKDHARCYRRNDTYGPGYANKRTGFRCCAK